MEFEFTEEQQMIRDMAQGFARDHGSSEQVRQAMSSELGYDPATWTAIGRQLGLTGLLIPAAQGGQGLGAIEMVVVFEALGRYLLPTPLLASSVFATQVLLAIEADAGTGSDDGRKADLEAYLSRLADGQARATVAQFTDGQAEFVPYGHCADLLVGYADEQIFVLPGQAPGQFEGVQMQPLIMLDQTRPLCRMSLTAPPPNCLAKGAVAHTAIHQGLNYARLAIAAEAVGAAQECLSRTVEYVGEREQFGRKIGSFQAVKHQLADMMINTQAAISAVYFAACAAAETPHLLAQMAAFAKVQASEALSHAAARMIQLHGGIGFTWEHDAHLYFKRARGTATLFGSNPALDETIAEFLLGDVA